MRTDPHRTGLLLVGILTVAGAPGLAAGGKTEIARRIASEVGVRRGLALDLGCGDAGLAIELARLTALRIECVESDEAAVAKAREAIDAAGLYGTRVTAVRGDLAHPTYPDNCANLIVCGDEFVRGRRGRDLAEILRFLNPHGFAYIGQSAAAAGRADGEKLTRAALEAWLKEAGVASCKIVESGGVWTRVAKPRPEAWGEWTHRARDAGNTYGSTDTAAVPPFKLQWAVESPPALGSGGLLVAGGREFALGLGYPEHPDTTPSIHAYDAYNGVELWSHVGAKALPIDRTWKNYTPEKASSDAVATEKGLYILGGKMLHVFHPDTGEILKSVPVPGGGSIWMQLMHADGLLVGAMGSGINFRKPGNHGMGFRGMVRSLVALDPERLAVRWRAPAAAWTNSLCAGGGRVYFVDKGGKLQALDVKTGRKVWGTRENVILKDHIIRLVTYHRGKLWILQFRRGGRKERRSIIAGMEVVAYSAEDGKKLFRPNFNGKNPTFLTFAGDHVIGTPCHSSTPATRMAESTGEIKWVRKLGSGGCTPAIATPGYLFGRFRGGPGFVDLGGEKMRAVSYPGLRPTCFFPPVPANGMIYIPAPGCNCRHAFRANLAMAPGTIPAADPKDRLVKGPAFGGDMPKPEGPAPWATWRRDARRSGATDERAKAPLKQLWKIDLPGRPTSLAAGGGLVFAGSTDRKLYALDAATGRKRWDHIAEGAIFRSPCLWEGFVYIGDEGGWVHCLRAADGALAWRFRVAPAVDHIVWEGRLTSRWPAGCGVLVRDGVVYCTAGFFPQDGGVTCELDARTGAVKSEQKSGGRGGSVARGPLALAGNQLFVPTPWGSPRTVKVSGGAFSFTGAGAGRGRPAKGSQLMVLDEGLVIRATRLEYIHHVCNYRLFSAALPVVTDETIYLRDGRHLTAERRKAYKLSGGRFVPVHPPEKKATSDPSAVKWGAWKGARMTAVVLAGDVLLSGGAGKVYATGIEGGKELWSAAVPGRVLDLAFQGGRLFVASDAGVVCFGSAQ